MLFDKACPTKPDEYSDSQAIAEENSRPQPVLTPADLRPLINGSKVVLQARLNHHGVVYARSSTHLGNSLIYFYPKGNKSLPPVPGSIKYIFTAQNAVAFAVQRHLNKCTRTVDPFARYPDFPAKLYSAALADKLEVVEVDWVMSHVARWQISSDDVVVLSLSKVSLWIFYFRT